MTHAGKTSNRKAYTKYFLFCKQETNNQTSTQTKNPKQQRTHKTKKAINFSAVTAVQFQLTNETEGDVKLNMSY